MGGNLKFRALRLSDGNFSWKSQAVSFKTRILGVVYNATNNELVRTNTLVKGAVVAVDAGPLKQRYMNQRKTNHDMSGEKEFKPKQKTSSMFGSIERAKPISTPHNKPDSRIFSQLDDGQLLAIISSRPGQCGRVAGHILEGCELDFYHKKLSKK